jgi:hypothetical protein
MCRCALPVSLSFRVKGRDGSRSRYPKAVVLDRSSPQSPGWSTPSKRSILEGTENAKRKKEALRLESELPRGTSTRISESRPMKPRHAAALALVGWYMMTPPLSANGEHRGRLNHTALHILGNCRSYTRKIHALRMGRRRPSNNSALVGATNQSSGMSLAPSPTFQSFL